MLDIPLGNSLIKSAFEQLDNDLRTRLLAFQQRLQSSGTPLLIVIYGLDGSGKGAFLTELGARMNPRLFRTHSFWDNDSCHSSLPFFSRYWSALPAKGITSIHLGAWYERLFDMAMGQKDINTELATVRNFEQTLADNGTHIVKIFLHLDKSTQKSRLEKKKNLFSTDSTILKMKVGRSRSYKKTTQLHNEIISASHMPHAPWHVIDATDPYWLLTKATELILGIEHEYKLISTHANQLIGLDSVFSSVDMLSTVDKDEYKIRKQQLQDLLYTLSWKAWQQKKSPILVFEGWDAAGKGGAIRRITEAIDPRLWTVYGSSAPNEVERQHHYLWRYWKTLPNAGKTSIYDRSWYGRVLVERVESFATEHEWKRAYREINEFETLLSEWGAIIVKFWIHITPEVQKRRFESREEIEYKNYKITDEDWRNRAKWDAYELAADEMIQRTSNADAPWFIIPGNDKYHARLDILEHAVNALKARLL